MKDTLTVQKIVNESITDEGDQVPADCRRAGYTAQFLGVLSNKESYYEVKDKLSCFGTPEYSYTAETAHGSEQTGVEALTYTVKATGYGNEGEETTSSTKSADGETGGTDVGPWLYG